MGKLMKAAHLTSCRALKASNINCPDAIITATSRGMLDVSMQFLEDITTNEEELLKPTLFMQSTHNTLGSAIAIRSKCYGYNITYSQGDDSLMWAMRDAERLIKTGKVKNVLVNLFDECTPIIASFAERTGADIPKELCAKSFILVRN